MPNNHLYSFRRCPYAMRARMALVYAHIKVKIQDIDLKNKPTEMLEQSPKGSVPVLILKNGTVIDESLDIMIWALRQHDPENWLSNLSENREIIYQNDYYFKHALDRYKYPNRYPDEDCSYTRSDACKILIQLNERLETQPFLSNNHITLADIAVFPFIRQFAHVDREWFYNQSWKPLISWLDNHLSSQLFEKIMDKNLTQLP